MAGAWLIHFARYWQDWSRRSGGIRDDDDGGNDDDGFDDDGFDDDDADDDDHADDHDDDNDAIVVIAPSYS